MAQFKVEIDIGAENPLTFVNEDLDEFSTSTFATSTPTKPNFDVFPNEGSIVIKDRNSELYQKAVNGEFDNAYSYNVRLYINNKKCAEHIIYQRPVYNYGKKTLTLRLSDLLNATLNTAYVGYNYPRTSETNKQIFTELVTAIFGSNAVLNIDNEQAFEDKTVQIPYIDFQSSREALAKSLRLSEHSLILDRNGTLKAVDMLGRNDNDKPIYKVYPKQMKEPFLPSLIADNKFNEIKVSGKRVSKTFNSSDVVNLMQESADNSDYINESLTVQDETYDIYLLKTNKGGEININPAYGLGYMVYYQYFNAQGNPDGYFSRWYNIGFERTKEIIFGYKKGSTDKHFEKVIPILSDGNLKKINAWTFDANNNVAITYDVYKTVAQGTYYSDTKTFVKSQEILPREFIERKDIAQIPINETYSKMVLNGVIGSSQGTANMQGEFSDNYFSIEGLTTNIEVTPFVDEEDGQEKLRLIVENLLVGRTLNVIYAITDTRTESQPTTSTPRPTTFTSIAHYIDEVPMSELFYNGLAPSTAGVDFVYTDKKYTGLANTTRETIEYVPRTVTISIGAQTETISFENIVKDIDYETSNPNKNIYSMSQDNTLIQEGYGYSQSDTNLFDGVTNEIHETYLNGLHSGDIRLIGANYNAFVGSGSKNFANGDLFDIGDLIVPCKDNQGTPIINGKVFKVISSNLSMRGGALEQRLGLIESVGLVYNIYEVKIRIAPQSAFGRIQGVGEIYVDGEYLSSVNSPNNYTTFDYSSKISGKTYLTFKFIGNFDLITFYPFTSQYYSVYITEILTWYDKLLANQFAVQNLNNITYQGKGTGNFYLPDKYSVIPKYCFNEGSDGGYGYQGNGNASGTLEIKRNIQTIEEQSLSPSLDIYFANDIVVSPYLLPQGKSVFIDYKQAQTTDWYTNNKNIANYYCPSNTTITFYKLDGTAWATFTCTATISGTTLSVSDLSASDEIYVGILANNEYTDFTSHTVTASETSWDYDLSQSIDTTIAQTILVRVHRNGYTAYNVTINYVPQ